jgi:hypothetical protein
VETNDLELDTTADVNDVPWGTDNVSNQPDPRNKRMRHVDATPSNMVGHTHRKASQGQKIQTPGVLRARKQEEDGQGLPPEGKENGEPFSR